MVARKFFRPIWNRDNGFEIMNYTIKYDVHPERRKCSYRAWQITEIPYPEDYLEDWCKRSTYLASYQFLL